MGAMRRTIAPTTIAKLNRRARGLVRREGLSVPHALDRAATEAGFREIRRHGETIIYRKGSGFVNCWTEGPMSQEIEPGGAGFDDQIEWDTLQ